MDKKTKQLYLKYLSLKIKHLAQGASSEIVFLDTEKDEMNSIIKELHQSEEEILPQAIHFLLEEYQSQYTHK